MVVELPESWSRVVGALVGGPVAWRTPGELAGALGWDEGTTTDLLALLDADGWLEVWEVAGGPFVTLSPLGAERLGVRLVEPFADRPACWAPLGDPEPARAKARHVCAGRRAADLEFLVDPLATPDRAAERAEAARRAATAGGGPLPFPTLLLGQGLTPWPGPGRDPAAPCPACGGRALRPHAYCLCCDRWGLDDSAAAGSRKENGPRGKCKSGREKGKDDRETVILPSDFPLSPGDSPAPEDGPGAAPGQAERARRKERHRRRMRARIEAERGRAGRGPRGPVRGKDSETGGPPLA